MIILLRDPVERAISQMLHARSRGFEDLEPEEAFEAEESRLNSGDPYSHQKHSYVSRSKYIEQLTRYEKLFKTEQLLILKSEDMFNNEQKAWEKILLFLGLEPYPLRRLLPKANRGRTNKREISNELRNKLKKQLESTAAGVKNKYGIEWGWHQ